MSTRRVGRTGRTVLPVLLVAMLATPLVGAAAKAPPSKGPTPTLTRFTETLPVPPTVDLTAPGSAYELVQRRSEEHSFHAQLGTTPTFGYNAPYLGPTLEVRRGVPVTVEVHNDLGAHPVADAVDTTLMGVTEADRDAPRSATHQHGGHLPERSDGGPLAVFVPPTRASQTETCATEPIRTTHLDDENVASCYRYEYPNDQEAATLWYHDHAVGMTRLNVLAGLAGFYLVRDDFDTGRPGNPLGLPTGDREIPLAIQDRSFRADPAGGSVLDYPLAPPVASPFIPAGRVWIPEFFGDTPIVNGKAYPNLEVDRGLYRFRVLNGSNARVYRVRLAASTGTTLPFFQIGTDGGLLDAPAPLTELTMAPGERADLLVDFSGLAPGTRVVVKNNAGTPFPNGPRAAHVGGPAITDIMRFTVGDEVASPALPVPATLRGGAGQPPAVPRLGAPTRVRDIMLNEILDPVTGQPVEALINNLAFHDHEDGGARTDRIETPAAGTVEQWNLINTTGDTHPIHLHLVQFQVQERHRFDAAKYLGAVNGRLAAENPGLQVGLPHPDAAGLGPWPAVAAESFLRGRSRAAPANEAGWKDTVQAHPGEVTRILVQFGGGADAAYSDVISGDFVFHCHILEHEDNDMMLPYQVRPAE